jgi:hypothetical protein
MTFSFESVVSHCARAYDQVNKHHLDKLLSYRDSFMHVLKMIFSSIFTCALAIQGIELPVDGLKPFGVVPF